MNRTEIEILRKRLLEWYRENRRDLPWRRTNDPYRIWVSEVMLQQTQVKTALPYYDKFILNFPTIDDLARSDLQAALKVWEGLGYYGRARNFHRAAKMVMEKYEGNIPDTWEAFRKLPGVGDYIAGAVMSIAFGRCHPVVDGNVKRLTARLLMIDCPVNTSKSNKKFAAIADLILDTQIPGTFNQAMMELGALICKPKNPLCSACPLSRQCRALKTRNVDRYPKKIKPAPTPTVHIAAGVVVKKDRVLITKRKNEGLLGGLWEFPGGKVKKGETAADACIREIGEEVNLKISVDRHLTRVNHAYTHFKIVMDVFICNYVSGRVNRKGPVAHKWIAIEKIHLYPFPKANHKFIPLLKQLPIAKDNTGRTIR